ncbi:hypothetical protein BaRGS_00028214 [Batillaria attramentaria]|uniref:ZU5 domain-containing protein n=1 Tax=Batillaria attramentaria TaxID=370345 RepID=A0ABD0K0G2_9CAEN
MEMHGDTQLLLACRNGQSDIANSLLDRGADVTIRDKEGNTALHFVSRYTDVKLIERLLENGGNVNQQNNDGDTPLHIACMYSNSVTVGVLLTSGADLDIANSKGNSCLHNACVRGDYDIVTLLLERECDHNARNENGDTVLHVACASGNTDVVRALLAAGVDINVTNKAHKTPLQVAQEHEQKNIEQLLTAAHLELADMKLKSQLIFSKGCQLRGEFSSVGGQLQGDSDVILVVPENAIQHPDTVTIAGAVSVDLKTVHDKLGLDQDEVIVSPVIEYVTEREDFVFQKSVRVYLPHFLPGSFSPNDVSVYQFYKGEDGNIHTEKAVRVAGEDNVENAEYDGSGGSFCILETDNILVFMSHFSGVFSCIKSWVLGPPQLHLRLYGEHIQRDTRDVDLDLLVSDKRLTIRDFIKVNSCTPQSAAQARDSGRVDRSGDTGNTASGTGGTTVNVYTAPVDGSQKHYGEYNVPVCRQRYCP